MQLPSYPTELYVNMMVADVLVSMVSYHKPPLWFNLSNVIITERYITSYTSIRSSVITLSTFETRWPAYVTKMVADVLAPTNQLAISNHADSTALSYSKNSTI